MFTPDEKRKAIETLIRFDMGFTDTIAELGYPERQTLYNWWREYERFGEIRDPKLTRKPKFTQDMKRNAVVYYLEHGKSLARTRRALGYPGSDEALCRWIDEIAPGERKIRSSRPIISTSEKIEVVAALEARKSTSAELAEKYGVSRAAPYIWRRQMLSGDNVPDERSLNKGEPVSARFDDLPDDVEKLKEMAEGLRQQVRRLELELDVRKATLEIIKKDQGTDPNRLTNKEKAQMIDSLRAKWKLKELLKVAKMAKSSYEYAARALARPESEERARMRECVIAAFKSSGGTYGYRRICAMTGISEWSARKIMAEEQLIATNCKKKRRYSSYAGEISRAPSNTCLKADGSHDFFANSPNALWVTDITEFRIRAGKVYLSPIIDCFDGMPIAWSISTSPGAELANASLEKACACLSEDEHPRIHSDRGAHYRWQRWISICKKHGLVRSMSRKGHSPDNSRMEGFFGRLKIEFFYGCDWSDVSLDEFIKMLDAYLVWYRDERLKSDLGYKSPLDHRRNLGLIA